MEKALATNISDTKSAQNIKVINDVILFLNDMQNIFRMLPEKQRTSINEKISEKSKPNNIGNIAQFGLLWYLIR